MKIKQLLTVAAITSALVALNARAQVPTGSVTFQEVGEIGPGGVISGFMNHSVSETSESVTFTGDLPGNFTGHYTIGLQEFAGGPLSDWLTVDWAPISADLTRFNMNFVSDTEGQTLQPPTGRQFDVLVPETGDLQTFTIPSTAFNVTVGMQSDVETVPDGGTTIVLLGLSSAGLAAFRRFRK